MSSNSRCSYGKFVKYPIYVSCQIVCLKINHIRGNSCSCRICRLSNPTICCTIFYCNCFYGRCRRDFKRIFVQCSVSATWSCSISRVINRSTCSGRCKSDFLRAIERSCSWAECRSLASLRGNFFIEFSTRELDVFIGFTYCNIKHKFEICILCPFRCRTCRSKSYG